MKNEEIINLNPSEADRQRVQQIISQHHKAGLNTKKAEELGLFQRISFLVCGIHSLNMVAYKMFGEVEKLFDMAGSRRHEIKMEIELMNKSFDRFITFFRGYQTNEGLHEMNVETEHFYHQFMKWCQLPEGWCLGDPQNTPLETDPIIKIDFGDTDLCFYRTTIDSEELSEPKETYCVTVYNPDERQQHTVGDEMDKASAQMVAKRLSVENPSLMYTASQLVTQEQRTIDAIPLKIFQAGKLIGSYRKTIRSKTK